MDNNMTYCDECRKDVIYIEKEMVFRERLNGKKYTYKGIMAICPKCGSEVYVGEIMDSNMDAIYAEYRRKNSLIPLEKLLEIPKKYGIGKRPLSLLLGWGELTFTRYCEGYMPTKQYSDILQKIYDDPNYYYSILESKRDNLKSNISYEKSLRATNTVIKESMRPITKIDIVSEYVKTKCEDISPLALKKALYYIQGFCYAFNGEYIFPDNLEPCKEVGLSQSEKEVIDSVIKNLCCYSGIILKDFTRLEEPWLEAKKDLPDTEESDITISRESIGKYFVSVKEIFKMTGPSDIKVYARKMFRKIN